MISIPNFKILTQFFLYYHNDKCIINLHLHDNHINISRAIIFYMIFSKTKTFFITYTVFVEKKTFGN